MTDTDSLPEVAVYTDGACDPNPGPGGWAALLRFGAREKELAGSDPRTTNNRMELQAVIAALDALKQPCRVTLHTDSEYVQKGVTTWLAHWKTKGWKKVANRDLWEALDQAAQRHHIEWRWVRGHAGDPLNERVDRLAVSMIPRPALPVDDPGAAHIFSGVSCLGATGPGGWAAIVRDGDAIRELTGHAATTSANRLHLLSVIEGLRAAPQGKRAHVYTPSDYVTQGAQQWVKTWSAQGWRTQEDRPVKHRDAWQALMTEAQTHQVGWHCLKGETRPPESQRAEELARQAARQRRG